MAKNVYGYEVVYRERLKWSGRGRCVGGADVDVEVWIVVGRGWRTLDVGYVQEGSMRQYDVQ